MTPPEVAADAPERPAATHLLLCTDLDRTLLPNGSAPESPRARGYFARLAARPEVALAYVSGRHRELIRAAIAEFALPEPDYAVGDVGTSIWRVQAGQWRLWDSWSEEIAPDWAGVSHERLAELFADVPFLHLQEPAKQGRHKLSYYAPADTDVDALLAAMEQRLADLGVRAALIWSLDETTDTGLLDLLPRRATKLHAVEFLMNREGFGPAHCVFSGDSGNDLPVLVSGLQTTLVANATPAVRAQVLREAEARGTAGSLYLARGGLLEMNGNYAAGILEGFVHFIPDAAHWIQPAPEPGME
jgi:HAD superfamily hydrolase (TIGR01484 family)